MAHFNCTVNEFPCLLVKTFPFEQLEISPFQLCVPNLITFLYAMILYTKDKDDKMSTSYYAKISILLSYAIENVPNLTWR